MMSGVVGVLDGLSLGQWGLVTTAQAQRWGVSRLQVSRLCQAGHLRRLGQGVYLDAGSPVGPFTHVQAAWLASDPGRTAEERLADPGVQVVVGGATAAFLHEVGDLQPEPVELYVPVPRQTRRAGVRYRQRLVPAGQVTVVAGLPVTSLPRTISDLVADGTDLSLVADLLADAITQQRVTLAAVEPLVDPGTFRLLVETAGLTAPEVDAAARQLAVVILDLLGPNFFTTLTRSIRPTSAVGGGLAQPAAGSLEAVGTREVLAASVRDVLPSGFVDVLRQQVAEAFRPALAAARAVTPSPSDRSGLLGGSVADRERASV